MPKQTDKLRWQFNHRSQGDTAKKQHVQAETEAMGTKISTVAEHARNALSRDDWIAAARKTLIAAGVEAVKIDPLSAQLGVSRGSFYWHFKDRSDLLDSIIRSWIEQNTAPFLRVLEENEAEPAVQLLRFCEVWLIPGIFASELDAAVRRWASTSEQILHLVHRCDDERLEVLLTIFGALGYDEKEALVRARTLYYHQIGYYTLEIKQTNEERFDLFPIYFRVLSGFPVPPNRMRWRI